VLAAKKKRVFIVAVICIKCIVLRLIHSTSGSRVACGNIIIYVLNVEFMLIIDDIRFNDKISAVMFFVVSFLWDVRFHFASV
jgi:hypothetical protein